jgi:hypothetical protein
MGDSSMFYFNISINHCADYKPAPVLRGLQVQPGLLIARAPSRARTRCRRNEKKGYLVLEALLDAMLRD